MCEIKELLDLLNSEHTVEERNAKINSILNGNLVTDYSMRDAISRDIESLIALDMNDYPPLEKEKHRQRIIAKYCK